MFILNKYNQNIIINFEGVKNNLNFKNSIKVVNINITYNFKFKTNFFREFIFFYSIFLITNQFSTLLKKNKPEFRLLFKVNSLFLINYDYKLFFTA